MTEEIYNKATCLRSIIEKEKKVLKYWEDGKSVAVETASTCSTAKGIVSKVSKFLNVK